MRLFFLTSLTMIAFAANSVLNRMALVGGSIDSMSFGIIRLIAGAVMLGMLCFVLRGSVRLRGKGRGIGVFSLLLYIFGFSIAYVVLDAGLGALILFGVVQITMFAGALIAREPLPTRRWFGAAMAFSGLALVLWPGNGLDVSFIPAVSMAAAGIGWGLYSLAGRHSDDALVGTAANFTLAVPIAVLLGGAVLFASESVVMTRYGVLLAVLSGAVTSGMGYALWYAVLPQLAASVAAVAQLTVPLIAMAGGMLLLGEVLTIEFLIACGLVLGGVAISVMSPRGT